ncbi:uncharacterized protein GGS22DRAFT_190251 [Annulohypoxylon maeteangense]|uniref:uncharacterized protein n=1 Tax=Annulohypoxylon maeteangense TaxID=1927788 RepID=UPI0020078597|nr:uncharacterized protein GGS22DRAFT_190251 [Annulohypoxylon maeteangense]KAI0883592.1 hypothetical protein GGS22DRAFT_190251 [Annulohypoxylon maeteangense]
MKTFGLVTKALLGVAPRINDALFGSNDSFTIGPVVPCAALTNSTRSVFATPTVNIPDLALVSTISLITTPVVRLDAVRNDEGVTFSEQLVDSVPPRITIDTIIAVVRPQEITEADSEQVTIAPASPGLSDISSPISVTSSDYHCRGRD